MMAPRMISTIPAASMSQSMRSHLRITPTTSRKTPTTTSPPPCTLRTVSTSTEAPNQPRAAPTAHRLQCYSTDWAKSILPIRRGRADTSRRPAYRRHSIRRRSRHGGMRGIGRTRGRTARSCRSGGRAGPCRLRRARSLRRARRGRYPDCFPEKRPRCRSAGAVRRRRAPRPEPRRRRRARAPDRRPLRKRRRLRIGVPASQDLHLAWKQAGGRGRLGRLRPRQQPAPDRPQGGGQGPDADGVGLRARRRGDRGAGRAWTTAGPSACSSIPSVAASCPPTSTVCSNLWWRGPTTVRYAGGKYHKIDHDPPASLP